ncbi:hypothetical protein K458DRAFT_467804 [Lentithecium fluviatile CBS 122367]|uniref:Aminoglycoside phosphotransferase domain-containing protein n=1 Tax=Lentithecium fluviatile CBS 122367 TaxID=1168545 RepID=A0A6G1JC99_9PLEO|nr:hypothetical protein K458DRAFT_467804 [Lentithecium fluviatile CBS 122367]
MNPYEAKEEESPSTDRYADVPLYGRYFPRPDDFKPEGRYINSTTPESLEYWCSVLQKCTETNRPYENQDRGRDVFAPGTVIIKSSHLKGALRGRRSHRNYSYADVNEVGATAFARKVLDEVKINGRDVFVQERIPGIGLNVAWQYISQSQKSSFKQQTRSDNEDTDRGFMHNDFSQSNCIADNDKIVGLVDRETAGRFGWKIVGRVHVDMRPLKRKNFAALNFSEEILRDILFWNDLYNGDGNDGK